MVSLYNTLFAISVLMSVARLLILFWITTRCARFLIGQWFRICCEQSVRTTIFVLICTIHSLTWTLHSAYLCIEVGMSLSDHWADGLRFVCNAQAICAVTSVAIHVALTVAHMAVKVAQFYNFTRVWSRKVAYVTMVLTVPVSTMVFGTFRYAKRRADGSGFDYVDISDYAQGYIGQNVSADLHLLLCDNNRDGSFPLTSIPVLIEIGVVLALVVVATVAKVLTQELSQPNTPTTRNSSSGVSHWSNIHLPCSDIPHPVDAVTNILPSIIAFWVIFLHPMVYAVLNMLQGNPWLHVGAGTHLLLVLASISVAIITLDRAPTLIPSVLKIMDTSKLYSVRA